MKNLVKANNNLIENNINFSNLINSYLEYIDVSENSLSTYKRCLKQFALYLNENGINQPTREDIIAWKDYLMENNKPNTVNLYLVSVKSLFKWLEYMNIYKDISKNVKAIRMDKKHLKRGLTQEEVKLVLAQCKDIREEVIMKLLLTCALRENELINIRLEDFYEENDSIMLKVMGKGRNGYKSDVVKVDNRIFDLIKEYCSIYNINDYLFTSTSNHNNGGKLNSITIRRIVTNLFKKANLNMDRLSTHSTRHFSATQALKSGMSLVEVSEMLRHSSTSITQIYVDEIKASESRFANILTDLVMQ